jgi:hypothetical protein
MSQNRKSPPSGKKIAEYWYDRLLDKHDDGTYYCNNLDIGEPACQGCGGWSSNSTKPSSWDHHGFEKAHIIPWSDGGSNDPSNFLMLCRHCHFDFDNEIYINDMKDFIKVSKWLEGRVSQKGEKIKKIIFNHIKQKDYDDLRFMKAYRLAQSKVSLGKEKSLKAYISRICESADAIYMTIANYDHLNVFEFLEEIRKIDKQNA